MTKSKAAQREKLSGIFIAIGLGLTAFGAFAMITAIPFLRLIDGFVVAPFIGIGATILGMVLFLYGVTH